MDPLPQLCSQGNLNSGHLIYSIFLFHPGLLWGREVEVCRLTGQLCCKSSRYYMRYGGDGESEIEGPKFVTKDEKLHPKIKM